MNPTALRLPKRAVKPRDNGLTMVIDGGIPLGLFADLVSLGAEYIDYVKFGWGTAVVTDVLKDKISILRGHDIGFYFGGTLFEKFVLQDRFEDYRKFCSVHACSHVEVSNGTIDMSNLEKAGYIRKLAKDFTVDPRWGTRTRTVRSCCRRACGSSTSTRTSTPGRHWSPWKPGKAGGQASAGRTAR